MKKLTLEEFGRVMYIALNNMHMFEGQKLGQCIFNATYLEYPELANSLRGTGADCFHQDSKVIHFVNAILES